VNPVSEEVISDSLVSSTVFSGVVSLGHEHNVSLYLGPPLARNAVSLCLYITILLTLHFFGNSVVLLTLFLGDGIWKWALWLTFQRNMLPSSAGSTLKMDGACSSGMLAT
jgi:hypothetical protein